jgi:hypothetical protein
MISKILLFFNPATKNFYPHTPTHGREYKIQERKKTRERKDLGCSGYRQDHPIALRDEALI